MKERELAAGHPDVDEHPRGRVPGGWNVRGGGGARGGGVTPTRRPRTTEHHEQSKRRGPPCEIMARRIPSGRECSSSRGDFGTIHARMPVEHDGAVRSAWTPCPHVARSCMAGAAPTDCSSVYCVHFSVLPTRCPEAT